MKGVGVESPEEETGKGLLIAVMIFSAIAGFVYGEVELVLVGRFPLCSGAGEETESGLRGTWFYSWPRSGVPESCGSKSRMRSSRRGERVFGAHDIPGSSCRQAGR